MKKSKKKIKLLSLTLGVVGIATTPLVTTACWSNSKTVKTVDTSSYVMPTALTFTGQDGAGRITRGLLKPVPRNTHLEYKVDDGAYSLTNPTTLNNGDIVSVNLAANDGYIVTNVKELLDQTVGRLNQSIDTSGYTFPSALEYSGNSGSGHITTVGNAPTHSSWQYLVTRIGKTPSFSTTPPTNLANGDVVTLKLVADSGYFLSTTVTNKTYPAVAGLKIEVDVTTYRMPKSLIFIGVNGSGSIATGLIPKAPTNTHLEYKVNNGKYSTTSPTTLSNGEKVYIRLIANNGYYLSETKELLDMLVGGLTP